MNWLQALSICLPAQDSQQEANFLISQSHAQPPHSQTSRPPAPRKLLREGQLVARTEGAVPRFSSYLQDQEKLNTSLETALQVKNLLSTEAGELRAQLEEAGKALRKAELEILQLQATNTSLTNLLEEIMKRS